MNEVRATALSIDPPFPRFRRRLQMKLSNLRTTSLVAILGLIALCGSTGCSSLFGARQYGPLDNLDRDSLKKQGYAIGPDGTEMPAAVKDDGRPSIVLEVHDGKKHMERIPMPADKPMFIGDIVKDAQLVEKVGRLELVIMRPTGPNLPPVRMMVDFDSQGKYVMEGQNYSLRPGDHVVVRKDSTSSVDRWVQNVAPWTKKK